MEAWPQIHMDTVSHQRSGASYTLLGGRRRRKYLLQVSTGTLQIRFLWSWKQSSRFEASLGVVAPHTLAYRRRLHTKYIEFGYTGSGGCPIERWTQSGVSIARLILGITVRVAGWLTLLIAY